MEYLLKSSAILSLFYVFYKLFLQKETFFNAIRGYFLLGIISALTLPFIKITKYIEVEPFLLPLGEMTSNSTNNVHIESFDWTQLIVGLYFLGIIVFTIRFLAQISSIIWFLFTHSKTKNGNYFIVKTTKNIAPFSFFNYIVYNDNLFNSSELEHIITHELAHVNQFHSIDIIFSQGMAILNWFNPFSWLYHKEILKNLEFTADHFAYDLTEEKKKYQYVLLKTISTHTSLPLTTNFYNSLLKKRINMLQKNRSKQAKQLKFTLILPILIAFIFYFNTTVIAQQKESKIITVKSDSYIEIITKDFQKSDFENLKEKLAEKNISLKYSKLKYNSNHEIISVALTVKNKNGANANLSQSSSTPINPIKIQSNNATGALTITNTSNVTHYSSNEPKNVMVTSNSDNDYVFISENGTETIKGNGTSEIIFISNDDKAKINKYTILSSEGNNITLKGANEASDNIWVNKDGDTTKFKKIEIIKKTGEGDQEDILFIENNGEIYDFNEEILSIGNESTQKTNTFVRASGERPLLIVDGKEDASLKIEEVDPKTIATINVLKGKKAIDAYGNKAKDGVIEIETKYYASAPKTNTIVIKASGKKPLLIIDGIEDANKKIEDMDPSTVESMTVLKGQKAIDAYGKKGTDGVIEIKTKNQYSVSLQLEDNVSPINSIVLKEGKVPIYEIDGVESTKEEALKIKNNNIKSITSLTGKNAINKYGKKGENGVLLITTKK